MTTRIILESEAGFSQDEIARLRQLFYDAFGEFVSARGGVTGDGSTAELKDALQYVKDRYPSLTPGERQRKAEQVVIRKRLARKVRAAASNLLVENLPETPPTPIEERSVVVLPTLFAESVEEEAKRFEEHRQEALRDAAPSPMKVYSTSHDAAPSRTVTYTTPPRRCSGIIPAPFVQGQAPERCSRGSGCKLEGCPANHD